MSPFWTALAALLLLTIVGRLTYLHLTVPTLELLPAPEPALALTVSRTLELEVGLAEAPSWERLLYGVAMQTGLEVLDETIGWYRELAGYSSDPTVGLQLAILEGEAGHQEEVQHWVERWAEEGEAFQAYAALIEAAYLQPMLAPSEEMELQAEAAEALPAGWFYDTLALRLAERAGDDGLATVVRRDVLERGRGLLDRLRVFLFLDLVMMLGAVMALLVLWRRPGERWAVGQAVVPPPWTATTGLAVLVRGGALGGLVMLAFLFLDLGDSPLRALAMPLIYLPLLVLARRHLFAPHGSTFADALGLIPRSSAGFRLLALVIVLVGTGIAGEALLGSLAELVGWSSHWSEWFDAELVWNTPEGVAATLVEYVVLAPVFEELVFRGLLFPTLRRRFGFASSALLSATLFGLAHGYGVLGLASVMWSGVLWSWAYERSGSLVPGIVAHATNNLLVCLTLMALLT